MALVSMKELLEAGVHFGHQTRRWNPKMKRYIYGGRNGIYIIDLHQTVRMLEDACNFVRQQAAEGGRVLFVGTKKQAQESIYESATQCGMFYVNQRWLGGMLTNFTTIRRRVERMKELRRMRDEGELELRPKGERARMLDQLAKLERILSGIEGMDRLPAVAFIVDVKKERIALLEARRLEIPVVAIVDTNCDPDEVTHPIPGNDDAIRAIRLMSSKISDAALEGVREREALEAKAAAEAEESAAAAAQAAEAEAEAAEAEPVSVADLAEEEPGFAAEDALVEEKKPVAEQAPE
ncbi:MAG: 30S ribosomal protein S2 [Armatimonadota bacterium]|nr:MAG: 30S ribosomal protein S2 [Armatimonadota bacterium]